MSYRKNVMALWKEFNPVSDRSIREDFQSVPSHIKKQIIEYLNNGEVILISPACSVDIFSNEIINQTKCVLTDGEFSWPDSLAYYVQKYNLCLPKKFEDKILNDTSKRQEEREA